MTNFHPHFKYKMLFLLHGGAGMIATFQASAAVINLKGLIYYLALFEVNWQFGVLESSRGVLE